MYELQKIAPDFQTYAQSPLGAMSDILSQYSGETINRPRVIVGQFEVSIQTGPSRYCEPRVNLPLLSQYSRVEIAIFEKDPTGGRAKWVNPRKDPRFRKTRWARLFETGSSPVAGYIPQNRLRSVMRSLAVASLLPL